MAILQGRICQCDICSHQWLPSVEHPKQCAKCKSYKWNDLGKQEEPQKITKEDLENGEYTRVLVAPIQESPQKDWPLCSICRRPIIDGKWHDHPCE
jgi:hypothetical protein